MENPLAKKNNYVSYLIKLAVGLFLLFGAGYIIPTWSSLTVEGVQSLCIFFGLVFLISCGDFGIIVPALFGFVALVMTNAYDGKTLMAATFGSTVVVQIIFAYVLCQVLIDTGAGEFIANWLLSRKILHGKPYLFCFTFFFASFLLGAFGHIGGIIFDFTLLDSIVYGLKYDEEGTFNKWMSLGSFVGACLGMALIPFQGLPLVIFGTIMIAMEQNGIALNYALYMFFIVLFSVLALAAFTVVMKVRKVEVERLRTFSLKKSEGFDESKFKITRPQMLACFCFLLGILYSVLTTVIPKTSGLMKILNIFDQCTWFILAIAIFFLFRGKDGKPFLNEQKTFSKAIVWGIILVICVFSVLGGMMASPKFGVRTWLNDVLTPIFKGMPFPVFMLCICLVSGIFTNFLSNAVVGIIVGTLTMPIAIAYNQSIGINLTIYGATITMAAMFCFLTMVAAGYTPLFLSRPCIKKDQKFIWAVGGTTLLGLIVLLAFVGTLMAFIF